MALTGNELTEIRKPDAKGNPAAAVTLVKLSQLTSLPAGTTIDVTPGRASGNQMASARPIRVSALGSAGVNDTVQISTPINSAAGTSAGKQTVLASAVAAFVS